ncbi:MAG: ribonuclease E/G, partial [Hyphomicrobiaceae bacterium]
MDKNKMLIDATHPEETRVVALRNGRVEEFDFESAARKLLRGNIYLAKVTRVEPSLQAAFIDYGGNRHGFLAFSEIHPDYYQIPVADREALKQEEAEAEQRAEAEADERARSPRGGRRRRRGRGDRNGDAPARGGEGRDDSASEVDTFEDGYQTSSATLVDDEPPESPSQSAPLRHGSDQSDVLHGEAHRESTRDGSERADHSSEPAHEPSETSTSLSYATHPAEAERLASDTAGPAHEHGGEPAESSHPSDAIRPVAAELGDVHPADAGRSHRAHAEVEPHHDERANGDGRGYAAPDDGD